MSLFGGRVTLNRRRGIKFANFTLFSLKLIHDECGKGTVFLFWPSLTWLLFLSRFLLCLFPVPTCPFLVSARAAVTELLLERKSHFFRPCIFGSSLRSLVGKASLRQLTEKRRTQSEPKFRRRRRGTRHPSRRRRARRARVLSPPGSVGPPARYGPPSPVRIFPVLPAPFFLLLAPELPKKKMVRPSVRRRPLVLSQPPCPAPPSAAAAPSPAFNL